MSQVLVCSFAVSFHSGASVGVCAQGKTTDPQPFFILNSTCSVFWDESILFCQEVNERTERHVVKFDIQKKGKG